MKAFVYFGYKSSTDCVLKILREDGVLQAQQVKRGGNEAEKFIRQYPPRDCDVVWLGDNPWSDQDFARAAIEYEIRYGHDFEGRV